MLAVFQVIPLIFEIHSFHVRSLIETGTERTVNNQISCGSQWYLVCFSWFQKKWHIQPAATEVYNSRQRRVRRRSDKVILLCYCIKPTVLALPVPVFAGYPASPAHTVARHCECWLVVAGTGLTPPCSVAGRVRVLPGAVQ